MREKKVLVLDLSGDVEAVCPAPGAAGGGALLWDREWRKGAG
jgi:hypothetical protein